MPQPHRAVKLTKAEQGALETFVADGKRSTRAITSARSFRRGAKGGIKGKFLPINRARALWGHRSFLI